MNRRIKYIRLLFIGAIFLVTPIFIQELVLFMEAKEEYDSVPDMNNIPATSGLPITTTAQEEWPKNELFLEQQRANYRVQIDEESQEIIEVSEKNAFMLIIPKLSIKERILDGTSAAVLKHGPGLYEYSQMPGLGDRNVIIAGHRSGYGKYYKLFRNIHELGEGDEVKLYYNGDIYHYIYKETVIITPDQSDELFLQGYSCLTLISCNPIGKNTQRILVRFQLNNVEKSN